MSQIFFDLTLSVASAFVGAFLPALPKKRRKLIIHILGYLLCAILLIWLGFEIGVKVSH